MRQRLAFLFPAAVLLIGTGAFAQTPDIEFHQVGYEGPRFYVWSIIQDTDGFIWYAGRGAIRRFDGRRIDEYDIIGGEWEDRSRRRISTLCMDAGGDLWAGGRGGSFDTIGTGTAGMPCCPVLPMTTPASRSGSRRSTWTVAATSGSGPPGSWLSIGRDAA